MRCPGRTLCAFLIVASAAACSNPGGNGAGNASNETAKAGNAATTPAPAESNAVPPAAAANEAAPAASAKAGASSSSSAAYGAGGSEPFWSLSIAGGQMAYTAADGPNVTEPLPARQALANGYRYQGTRLIVTVDHSPCEAMDGTTRPDTVTVVVDGATVSGCGG